MRRSLGYKLQSAGTGLLDFVTFMEHHRASYITHSLALASQTAVGRSASRVNATFEPRARVRAPSKRHRSAHADSAGGVVAVSAQAGAAVHLLG